jgi:hypothetical protein
MAAKGWRREKPFLTRLIIELMFFLNKGWKGKGFCNISNMERGCGQWQDREACELNEYYGNNRRWKKILKDKSMTRV